MITALNVLYTSVYQAVKIHSDSRENTQKYAPEFKFQKKQKKRAFSSIETHQAKM